MEEWRQVPGYDNYEVSNLGNVRSNNLTRFKIANRILKPQINGRGYLHVSLSKGGIAKSIRIHRIVALTFIPNPYNKPCVNHINEVITDNRLINLEWNTVSENTCHSKPLSLSGHRYIHITPWNTYYLHITSPKVNKTFKTLPAAIEARDAFLGHIGSD